MVAGCGDYKKMSGTSPQPSLTPSLSDGGEEVAALGLTSTQCADAKLINSITVSRSGSILINDPQVVGDARATGTGPWSFAFLMREIFELAAAPGMAPTALAKEDAAIKGLLDQFTSVSAVNSFVAAPRSSTRAAILSAWGKVAGSDGKLYLSFERAPLKLVAIMNRLDLVKKGQAAVNAGEGRFVFSFTGSATAMFILEYDLPIGAASANGATLASWVTGWQGLKNFLKDTDANRAGVQPNEALGALQFSSTQSKVKYLAALQVLTDKFTSRAAQKNGTATQAAISQVRTNEFIQGPWELREFARVRQGASVALKLTTVKNNPNTTFRSGQNGFSNWITANVTCPTGAGSPAACSFNTVDGGLPASFKGTSGPAALLGASSINDGGAWFAGKTDFKHRFVALNTCSGCHLTETRTSFVQIGPSGAPARFLKDDVVRRALNLKNLVCQVATSNGELSLTEGDLERLGTSSMVH
jgi:hypothetical protein